MPHKAKKHGIAVKANKEIKKEDLLAESQDFIDDVDEENVFMPVISQDDAVAEREDRHKGIVMWTGISFFVILISVIWIFNMRNTFKSSSASSQSGKDWTDLSKELDKTLASMKEGVEKLDKIAAEAMQASTTASATDMYNAASIAELKKELEGAATTTAATTTTSTTVKNIKKK